MQSSVVGVEGLDEVSWVEIRLDSVDEEMEGVVDV